jgi:hypothetical protein
VIADGKLRLEDCESLLDESQKSADVMVGAVGEGFVQQGLDPESPESHCKIGRICEAVLPLDQSTNDPLQL